MHSCPFALLFMFCLVSKEILEFMEVFDLKCIWKSYGDKNLEMSKKYWNENDQKKKIGLIISNFFETDFQCEEDMRIHKEEMKNINWKHWEHLFFYSWNSGKNMKNTIFFIIWKPDFRKHGEHLRTKNILYLIIFVLESKK